MNPIIPWTLLIFLCCGMAYLIRRSHKARHPLQMDPETYSNQENLIYQMKRIRARKRT